MEKPQNLLLVSNDEQFHHQLELMLNGKGSDAYNITCVYSLENAVKILDQENFALVVLDLPQEKAESDIADQVRETFGRLPVVLLSSSGYEHTVNAIRKGFQQVVNKSHIDNEMMLMTIISSIERQQMENELRMRDEILKAVNDAAEVFLRQTDWDAHLGDILSCLGEATESDRVYIYQNHLQSDGELCARIFYEWSIPGLPQYVESESSREVAYRQRGYSQWLEKLQNGQTIHADLDSFPSIIKLGLNTASIQSLVLVPIFSNDSWWGLIGFEHCLKPKIWSSAEIDAVKTSANMIGAAISRQMAEEELKYLATHDPLTDLPNRLLFADRFQQAVSRASRSGEKVAVICLDLDKFKSVNDTYGHPIGDKALTEVASRLSGSLRGSDTCARIGGDEFGIIADNLKNEVDAIRVMEKLNQALLPELELNGKKIKISASMGASLYPDHGTDLETLLSLADKALYHVKNTQTIFRIFKDDEQYSWLKE